MLHHKMQNLLNSKVEVDKNSLENARMKLQRSHKPVIEGKWFGTSDDLQHIAYMKIS